MITDELNSNHLIAAEGKVLRRISDGWVAGVEIYLGYTYQLNGEQLEEPLLELPEHYEEIDTVLEEATGEAFEVTVSEPVVILLSETTVIDEQPVTEPPKQVTLADLLVRALTEIDELRKEINKMKNN